MQSQIVKAKIVKNKIDNEGVKSHCFDIGDKVMVNMKTTENGLYITIGKNPQTSERVWQYLDREDFVISEWS